MQQTNWIDRARERAGPAPPWVWLATLVVLVVAGLVAFAGTALSVPLITG